MELQWKDYVAKLKASGTLSSTLAMADVSGSMSGLPMQVAPSAAITAVHVAITCLALSDCDESEDDSASCQNHDAAAASWPKGVQTFVCSVCACLVFVLLCDMQPCWLFVAVITQEQADTFCNPKHRRWCLHAACQASCLWQQHTCFKLSLHMLHAWAALSKWPRCVRAHANVTTVACRMPLVATGYAVRQSHDRPPCCCCRWPLRCLC